MCGYRVKKKGAGFYQFSKSYPTYKKAERARKRKRGAKVIRS